MLGTALIYRDGGDRQRGFKVLAELRDMCAKQHYALNAVPQSEGLGAVLSKRWRSLGFQGHMYWADEMP